MGCNGILHTEAELLILLSLMFYKGLHWLDNHILNLIKSDGGGLCIVERSGANITNLAFGGSTMLLTRKDQQCVEVWQSSSREF